MSIQLPSRKWYTLEQAAAKLTREAGEPVTVEDLLHFAKRGLLEICAFIDYNEGNLKIDGLVDFEYLLNDKKRNYNPKIILNLEQKAFYEIAKYNNREQSFLEKETIMIDDQIGDMCFCFWDKDQWELTRFKGLITLDAENAHIGNVDIERQHFISFNFIQRYISLADSETDIRACYIPRGYYLDTFSRKIFMEFKPHDASNEIREYPEEFDDKLWWTVSNGNFHKINITLDKNYLLISAQEIEIFKSGAKPTGIYFPTYHEIHQPSRIGRPESDIKPLAIELARLTFEAYPYASQTKIAGTLLDHLEKHYSQEFTPPALSTLRNWLTEEKIGAPKNQSKRHKIKIIDPQNTQ